MATLMATEDSDPDRLQFRLLALLVLLTLVVLWMPGRRKNDVAAARLWGFSCIGFRGLTHPG